MQLQNRINQPANQPPNKSFAKLASDEQINNTVKSLKENGIQSFIAETAEESKAKIFELIPEGKEVFTATSQTLEHLAGILDEIPERYESVRAKLAEMDPKTQNREMVIMGAVPEYMVGSVHAVTETGSVLIASNTGSQLAGYAASAAHVIWVVGTQKIVPNIEEGIKRVYEYTYPLEDLRAQKAYNGMHSNISKLLLVNREINPERTKVIFVKENLGF
ncbi:lactate utilization protein [bacterium]|nr:lactate utilization protein [bacterium]